MPMGNLTPLGVLASEPTKILMVRSKISTVTSIASVTIENMFYTASVCVVLLSGTWLFLQHANVPPGLEQISEIIVASVAIAAVVGIWAARPVPRCCRGLLRSSRSSPARPTHRGRRFVTSNRRFTRSRSGRSDASPTSALWEIAFHVGAVAEVLVVLRLLVPDITVTEAFLLESAGRFVTVAFKFVPYRLGIDEAGSGAVASSARPAACDRRHARARPPLRIIVLNAIGLLRLVRK